MPDLVLLHFEPRHQHAGHYLLFSKRTGFGRSYAQKVIAGLMPPPHPLVTSAIVNGCDITIASVFHGATRTERRRMRRNGGLSRFCPVCWQTGSYHR